MQTKFHQMCPRIDSFFSAVAINKSSDCLIIVFHPVACYSIFHRQRTCNADQMLASFSVAPALSELGPHTQVARTRV